MSLIKQTVNISKGILGQVGGDHLHLNMNARQIIGSEDANEFNLELWMDNLPKPKLKNAILDILAQTLKMFDGNKTQAALYLGQSVRLFTYRNNRLSILREYIQEDDGMEPKINRKSEAAKIRWARHRAEKDKILLNP